MFAQLIEAIRTEAISKTQRQTGQRAMAARLSARTHERYKKAKPGEHVPTEMIPGLVSHPHGEKAKEVAQARSDIKHRGVGKDPLRDKVRAVAQRKAAKSVKKASGKAASPWTGVPHVDPEGKMKGGEWVPK